MRPKLTPAMCREAKIGSVLWDHEIPGLMLRVRTRVRAWHFYHRTRAGTERRPCIGHFPEMSLNRAREVARDLAIEVARGNDPSGEWRAKRDSTSPASWTVGELMTKYLARDDLRDTTLQAVRHHLPYLSGIRTLQLRDLTKSRCRAAHAAIGAKTVADGAFRYLRAAYNWACKYDDANELPTGAHSPLAGVKWNPKRAKPMHEIDLEHWSKQLRLVPDPRRQFHALMALGGFRGGTLAGARWDYIKADRIVFPGDSMKSGRMFVCPLSRQMNDVLNSITMKGPFLFPAKSKSGHLTVWREPELEPATGHQLRKQYKSVATSIGIPDAISGALLDHAQVGLNASYESRLAMFDALADAQQRISDALCERGLQL
jgi:hypothetical protein